MAHAPRKLSFHLEVKMLKIIPADTETQYRQVRELLTEYIAWDAAQLGQLGLDAPAGLDLYLPRAKKTYRARLATTTYLDKAIALYSAPGFRTCLTTPFR
jgi:hypothetical protein